MLSEIKLFLFVSLFFSTRVSIDENINVEMSIHMDVGMYKNLQAKERTPKHSASYLWTHSVSFHEFDTMDSQAITVDRYL